MKNKALVYSVCVITPACIGLFEIFSSNQPNFDTSQRKNLGSLYNTTTNQSEQNTYDDTPRPNNLYKLSSAPQDTLKHNIQIQYFYNEMQK